MAEKPNIIYIFPDQHRGDTLGCVGHPAVITPNLDKIAAEGVIFTHCFTNSPLCMPARASMMSGQYVCEHGVWFNDNAANPLGPSHVRNIRNAGYHTALIGKTHLWVHGGNLLNIDGTAPRPHTKERIQTLIDWGFDDIHEVTGPIATVVHDSPYTDYLKEKGLLKVFRDYMIEYTVKWAAGRAAPWEEPPSPVPTEDHLDSYTGRKAIEWIQDYNSEKPFYLQILFPGPHDPFDSPSEYRAMYKPEDMPVGILEYPQKPRPPYVNRVLRWSGIKNMTPAQNQILRSFYYAKITLIDEYIGRIIKTLEEKDLMENTWIIYNSDHGEMLGDHMMCHKIVFYEGALYIPCIIRPPGGIKSWKSKVLTDHLDIAASLIDIAKADPLKGSDGRSLIPRVLNGSNGEEAQKGKEVVFSEVTGFSMVRSEQYKMAVSSKRRKPLELFDLKKDPKELRNLVKDPDYESLRQELLDNHLNILLKRMKKI
ncbi:MAG: sulfatase-like hydrolase/transferase [Candidatus Helarchaeota archaeon]|nr:sulfatase-like hydrolase/transferase [Candidatus Helarchaeota archaeon]